MFIGIYLDKTGERCCALFDGVVSFSEWENEIDFWEPIDIIDFNVAGRDYDERKECVRDIAVKYSNADLEGFNYSELAKISEWFNHYAVRYGLLREFTENGIC